jgi:hypothetical protein
LDAALPTARHVGRAGADPVRREEFPQFDASGEVTMRDMLVDFAPYLFRGRMGGLPDAPERHGLANVTSGGGQVPAFVIEEG